MLKVMKKFMGLTLFSIFFFVFSSSADASLVTIKNTGEVIQNVLSLQDGIALVVPQSQDIEVTQEVSEEGEEESVYLEKNGDSISLTVGEGVERKTFDITTWNEDLIEIEEREDTEKISIFVHDNKFAIEQGGFTTYTDYPINIDPKENRISLKTTSGSVFLAIFPIDAVQTVLRSKLLTRAMNASLLEKDVGTLAYEIQGEKEINLFNITKYSVPVKTQVSASTGEILFVDQPVWLKVYNLLLG